jgi:class 3 adenylate cyclase
MIVGLVDADQLTHGVVGDPPRTAPTLSGRAGPEQTLVDEATAAELRGNGIEPATGFCDLRGASVSAMVLTGKKEQEPRDGSSD